MPYDFFHPFSLYVDDMALGAERENYRGIVQLDGFDSLQRLSFIFIEVRKNRGEGRNVVAW